MESKICEKCSKNEIPSYRKKYCDDCANAIKAEYEAKQGDAHTDGQIQKPVSQEKVSLISAKDCSIIGQCMVKCVAMSQGKLSLGECLDLYHEAVHSLETNG